MTTLKKTDPDQANEQPASLKQARSRIDGAQQLGGVWHAADGSPLTGPESRQAHQAADRAAAEARRKAILGVRE